MKAELCPECGSNKIESGQDRTMEHSVIEGALGPAVRCDSCGWAGRHSDLLKTVGGIDWSAEVVAQKLSEQYMLHLHKEVSKPIGVAMVRAGVVGGKEDPKVLGQIIRAATMGAHKATLEEIEKIQKEKQGVERPS